MLYKKAILKTGNCIHQSIVFNVKFIYQGKYYRYTKYTLDLKGAGIANNVMP